MKHTYRLISLCAGILFFSEIWKQWTLTVLIGHGTYDIWYVPFQLCSIPMYVCLALTVLLRRPSKTAPVLFSFLSTFGLLGGICAFFDTSGMHYSYFPLTVHSYAWHILLIALGCLCGLCRQTDHSARSFRFSALLYLGCCAAATALNLLLSPFGEINLFYINPLLPMRQKYFCRIAALLGNNAGIAVYILATIAGAWILHKIWGRMERKRDSALRSVDHVLKHRKTTPKL